SASTTVSGRSPGTVESPRSRSQALTPKASAARAVRIIRRMSASERALHNFDVEALDDIALLDVLELAEAHAAFLTHLHLVHLFLEALQGGERSHFLNDNVVAQNPDLRALPDNALGDLHARNLADLGNVEHLQNLGVAEEGFARMRRQHAGHDALNVVDQ